MRRISMPGCREVGCGAIVEKLEDRRFLSANVLRPGELDPTFGGDGKVNTDLGSTGEQVMGVAVQSDGKIVAVGGPSAGASSDFVVIRYNANGSLDTSFGPDHSGVVTTDFFGFIDDATAVALQADGKIVVAGLAVSPTTGLSDYAVARYNPDGTLDTTFGVGGKVTTDFFGSNDDGHAVVIQPDGKIVVAGLAVPLTSRGDFGLVRYNPDGTLDTSFNGTGKVTTAIGDFAAALSVILLPNGDILAGGNTQTTAGFISSDFALAAYTPSGLLDSGFGSGGIVTIDFRGGPDLFGGLALQGSRRIIAAGGSFTPAVTNEDFALAGITLKGTLDKTFGQGGKVLTDFFGGNDQANAVVVEKNGRIIAGGLANHPGAGGINFALARYLPNGRLDPTFGNGGKVDTDFFGHTDIINALALYPGNRLIAAGTTDVAGPPDVNFDYALARYFLRVQPVHSQCGHFADRRLFDTDKVI